MIWPFTEYMVIIGSFTLLISSILILIYSIAQKVKIPQAILFSVIGFCSLAYCFKILFWPGYVGLTKIACIYLVVGIFFVFRGKRELTISKIILGLGISFFLLTFATKQSKLHEILRINTLKPEYTLPSDYYLYAWLLYKEGDFEQSKSNIQNAIRELNNQENVNYEYFSNSIEYQLKIYQSTINLIEIRDWNHIEYPPIP